MTSIQQIHLWLRDSIVFQKPWRIQSKGFLLLIAIGYKGRNVWLVLKENNFKLEFIFGLEARESQAVEQMLRK